MGIFSSKGGAIANGGLDLENVIKYTENGGLIHEYPEYGNNCFTAEKAVKSLEKGVIFESTPTNLETGEPGLSITKESLNSGWHVVIANKGPLVKAFNELSELAISNNVSLKMSGAAAAALPTLDMGEKSLAGANIYKFEAILNGTTNHILSAMSLNNEGFKDALDEAKKQGIAESDPALDVEGWDTACKTLIIANQVMKTDLSLEQINVKGITGIGKKEIEKAANKGEKIKLIGKCERSSEGVKASVEPVSVKPDHPLYNVEGGDKGIVYYTGTFGKVVVTGGESKPVGTAAAMLKDLINIYN